MVVSTAIRMVVSSGVVMRGSLVVLVPMVGGARVFVVVAVLGQLSFGLDARPGPEHCMATASAPRTGRSTTNNSRSQKRNDFTTVRLARTGKFNLHGATVSPPPDYYEP